MATVNHAYPMDSIVNYDGNGIPSFDRAVTSMVLRSLIHGMFSDGILMASNSNAMQVIGNSSMTVKVNGGFCVIQGAMKVFGDRTLSVTAADNTFDRIDTVVARLNLNQDTRDIDLYIHEGVAGNNPTRPDLTRTDYIYEIGLADLYINAGASSIAQNKITDTRLEIARCGVVSSVSQFDTTTLYNQIQADLNYFKSISEQDFNSWSDTKKQEFIDWFNDIKNQLTEDVAGHLQSEIDSVQSDVTAIDSNIHGLDTRISGLDSNKENKRAIATATIATNQWSSGTYSFEGTYPNVTYDIEQVQPYGTVDQLKAWSKAMIVGNPNGNTITCRGTVPSVNIPIVFYVRRK